jgi:hypothetical protein
MVGQPHGPISGTISGDTWATQELKMMTRDKFLSRTFEKAAVKCLLRSKHLLHHSYRLTFTELCGSIQQGDWHLLAGGHRMVWMKRLTRCMTHEVVTALIKIGGVQGRANSLRNRNALPRRSGPITISLPA